MAINKSAKHLSNLAHASMTPEQRIARAKKASAKRWAGHITKSSAKPAPIAENGITKLAVKD